MPVTVTDEMVEDMKRDGFVVARKAFSEEDLCTLESELKRMSGELHEKRDIHFIDQEKTIVSSMHNMHKYSPFWCDLVRNSGVHELVRRVYGSVDDRVFNGSFFAKPAKVGLETTAHQDNAFNYIKGGEILTTWISLDHANEENGGLYYYPGSHDLGDIEHVPEGNLGASMMVSDEMIDKLDLKDRVVVDLERGDCVIHNALVIHGSDANTSERERRGCNFSIASKADWDENAIADYEEKLQDFLDRKKPD